MTADRQMTRRSLLRRAAGWSVGGPLVIPSSVLPAGDNSPSERIRIGMIGLGDRGKVHLTGGMGGAFRTGSLRTRKDIELVTYCDVIESRLPRPTQREARNYIDFRELLAREDIDAVVISTPDHWHAVMVNEAARAGKDIYCEKPLSLTIREARAIVRAANRYESVFQTGSQQRSDISGRFRFACEMVRSGRIGQVKQVRVYAAKTSSHCDLAAEPVPAGLHWDMWLGPAPWRPYNGEIIKGWPIGWRLFRDYSGGEMTDAGAHYMDIVQWGLGTERSGPVEIIPPDGKDAQYLTYVYANGTEVIHNPAKGAGKHGAFFVGTEGTVAVDGRHLETRPASIANKPIGPDEAHLYRSTNHHSDWLRAVRTRQKPICDAETGCRSVTVCHLGNIARWLGRPLKWDPVKEKFVGDAEANRCLDRTKREPWAI
ncbi:MAG: Gfo/Idh/MocA family protein [Planctomycetota bacterium]